MADTDAGKTKQPAEINVADFSNLIAGMSRLLIGLATIAPFKDAKLGLAEWVALSVLMEKDGLSNKNLGRSLGVSGQRANQIGTSLSKAGLISVVQSTEDSRRNEIKITDAGKAQFNAVNSQLKPLLASALVNREQSLATVSKRMKTLMRIVQVNKPNKKAKKEKKATVSEAA